MLYSEFLKGTGCRQNDFNHDVYKKVEAMYMNIDGMTHEEAYEIGKKLVCNARTPEENDELEYLLHDLEDHNNIIQNTLDNIEYYSRSLKEEKEYLAKAKAELKPIKARIAELKSYK